MGSVGVKVTEPVELAPGVWRAGTELVNWYLVEEGGRVTIVDAGLPRYRPQLDRALERMGRSLADVAAIVLTHAHPDHVGLAEPLRVELGVPVHVHAGDEQLARTKKAAAKNERSFLPYLRYPFAYRLLGHLIAAGAGATASPQRSSEPERRRASEHARRHPRAGPPDRRPRAAPRRLRARRARHGPPPRLPPDRPDRDRRAAAAPRPLEPARRVRH